MGLQRVGRDWVSFTFTQKHFRIFSIHRETWTDLKCTGGWVILKWKSNISSTQQPPCLLPITISPSSPEVPTVLTFNPTDQFYSYLNFKQNRTGCTLSRWVILLGILFLSTVSLHIIALLYGNPFNVYIAIYPLYCWWKLSPPAFGAYK